MAPTAIIKRKDLPRHLVRQWYSIPLDKATTRVDAEPGENRKNSPSPQEDQVLPWDLLMVCRYQVTTARVPPAMRSLMRPRNLFFLRPRSEGWKADSCHHLFGPQDQQAATRRSPSSSRRQRSPPRGRGRARPTPPQYQTPRAQSAAAAAAGSGQACWGEGAAAPTRSPHLPRQLRSARRSPATNTTRPDPHEPQTTNVLKTERN